MVRTRCPLSIRGAPCRPVLPSRRRRSMVLFLALKKSVCPRTQAKRSASFVFCVVAEQVRVPYIPRDRRRLTSVLRVSVALKLREIMYFFFLQCPSRPPRTHPFVAVSLASLSLPDNQARPIPAGAAIPAARAATPAGAGGNAAAWPCPNGELQQ